MGITHSTARYLAPASFIYDFACQQYGLATNMKAVHDNNLSFWSPQPYFIGAFFFPQQICQLIWLYKLWKGTGKGAVDKKRGDDNVTKAQKEIAGATSEEDLQQMVDYTPIYALGNICIGTWMFFWNREDLRTSNIFCWVNTLSQLGYIYTRLGPMNTKSTSSILTHIVAKTFAGIGVLDILHNTSVAYFDHQLVPSTTIKVITGLGFAGLAAGSDWILGSCLVYDLIGLSVGQGGPGNAWGGLLAAYAAGTGAIVGLRNWFMPPYVAKEKSYTQVAQDEVDDRV